MCMSETNKFFYIFVYPTETKIFFTFQVGRLSNQLYIYFLKKKLLKIHPVRRYEGSRKVTVSLAGFSDEGGLCRAVHRAPASERRHRACRGGAGGAGVHGGITTRSRTDSSAKGSLCQVSHLRFRNQSFSRVCDVGARSSVLSSLGVGGGGNCTRIGEGGSGRDCLISHVGSYL